MGRLAGKVAIVTGAAQGMGEAHARRFVTEGADVVLTDINEDLGLRVSRQLGARARFIRHDVASADSWRAVISEAESAFGPVSVLINNAGVLGPISSTVDFSESDFLKVCAINQLGVFLGMKYVIPSMLKAGSGSIINVSSVAGIVAIYGTPNVAYAASKFAVRGLTKHVAIEYGAQRIRANSVHPGYIKTPMMTEALDAASAAAAAALVPIKRMADPAEVADLMVFLASDESSFITGTEQIIDGGVTAQ
ncbi:MAG TPA: glucose 1-dehydrogenase [Steroidobacteraceae bacterium]|nr:glucose 1-dehydrogenase [Steroidobacteraceae bacterium]